MFNWNVTYRRHGGKTYKATVAANTQIGAKKAACKQWGKGVCRYDDPAVEAFICRPPALER